MVSSPTVTGSGLNAVSAVSPTDIWAVGSQPEGSTGQAPLIENFNGTSWNVATLPSSLAGLTGSLTGISAISNTDVFAVGSANGLGTVVLQFNGTTWNALANLPVGLAGAGEEHGSSADPRNCA